MHLRKSHHCITCTLCKKSCTDQSRRRLADRFRNHLRDAEENDTDASKPVARYFNLPNQSHHNTTICGMSLHHGNTESRKNLGQKFIFQLGTLYPQRIKLRLYFFYFIHKFMSPYFHQRQTQLLDIIQQHLTIPQFTLTKARNVSFVILSRW